MDRFLEKIQLTHVVIAIQPDPDTALIDKLKIINHTNNEELIELISSLKENGIPYEWNDFSLCNNLGLLCITIDDFHKAINLGIILPKIDWNYISI